MLMKKKLLVYAHYFYPDVASTSQILTELCEGLQEDFEITVICVVPSYSGRIDRNYKAEKYYYEKYKKINIVRIRVPEFDKKNKSSRIKNILAYFFKAIIATFKVGKQDVVFSISQPPILGGILGVIGKVIKRAKFIYNIQDFNPEQTEAIGYAKNSFVIGFAKMLDKLSCRLSDNIIIVGRDMKETLDKRFGRRNNLENKVINNWIDEKQIYPLQKNHPKILEFKKKYDLQDKLVFMYSGNLGLYYDLENIIKVIGKFKDKSEVVFAFIGDGNMKQTLVKYSEENKLDNVKFIPYQDKKELNYALNAGDVHIVASAKGIKGISVPSKIYGVMATGKTIIGILEEGSEARRIVEEAGCGLCVEPSNYDKLFEVFNYIIEDIDGIKDKGILGRTYLEKYLKKELSILKYKQSILDV